ncbi:hypothetical protein L9F63_017621, partial [Diploptera punctata]
VVLKCKDLLSGWCSFKGPSTPCCKVIKSLLTETGYCFSFNSKFAGSLKYDPDMEDKFTEEFIYETDHKWSLTMQIKNENESIAVYLHSSHDYPVIDERPQHVWDQMIRKISFASKETFTTEGAQGFTYCNISGLQCLGRYKDKFTVTRDCPCELGCSNTVYEVEKLVEGKGDMDNPVKRQTLEIGFVSWPMVRYKREVLFGWVDLLVSFGGIAGLFLGFSLLSGVEIIYYFTMRAICMVYRDKKDLQRLKEEYDRAPKPPLDLSLKPSFMEKKEEKIKKYPIPSISSRVYPMEIATKRINIGNEEKFKSLKPGYSQFEFLQ